MKTYTTIVFEHETDEELAEVRAIAHKSICRAWSMEHELIRLELVQQAIEDKDLEKAAEYIEADNISNLLHELRTY